MVWQPMPVPSQGPAAGYLAHSRATITAKLGEAYRAIELVRPHYFNSTLRVKPFGQRAI